MPQGVDSPLRQMNTVLTVDLVVGHLTVILNCF